MSLRRRKRSRPPEDFDWRKSAKIGADLLEEAGVPHALIGRLAVWTYVSADAQQTTYDVDLAVPHGSAARVARAADERGYEVRNVDVGGYRVRVKDVRVDFIDGHPQFSALYSEAIKASQEQGDVLEVGDAEVPVVPAEYLVAMKLASGRARDDRDIEEVITIAGEDEYREIRRTVVEHLGYAMGNRLDVIARRIGHPGPGPERSW